MGAKKAPKGSPRGSQDGAKKEKKNEVKLREARHAKGGVKEKQPGVVTRPLGEKGRQDRPETAPRLPKTAAGPLKTLPKPSTTAPRPSCFMF